MTTFQVLQMVGRSENEHCEELRKALIEMFGPSPEPEDEGVWPAEFLQDCFPKNADLLAAIASDCEGEDEFLQLCKENLQGHVTMC